MTFNAAATKTVRVNGTNFVPSLPKLADWNAYEVARQALMPNLSRAEPAARLRGRREVPSKW